MFKSEFLETSKQRGFIHQGTDIEELDDLLAKGSITAYLGFDPTADSLHIGHLVGIMWLRLLQKTGHKPIVLIGGATSMIGDPTFKDTARQLLSQEEIKANIAGIEKSFSRFLNFGTGSTNALLVNNADWLSSLKYLDFLRDYGRHFSVNRMLTFDSVKLRLDREQPLSFLEFNYMILQAYDFWELYNKHNCLLELGGSDQWGNIVNGVELTRRMSGKRVYGLTTPLIMTSAGVKMGKTSQGAVWLNKDKLSSYDYWQFWRNTDDRDVGRYLRLFTDLSLDEIERLEKLEGAELNQAKKVLADEATALARGMDDLPGIHETVAGLFEQQSGDMSQLPKVLIKRHELPMGMEDMFVRSGLCVSKGEAKRLVQGGGARLNDQVINDSKNNLTTDHFENGSVKVSSGKKKHVVLELA
ncbi:MAG: tyrosine--tRNA ligase [Alphaproteobacteria bacterium]|nr:tyrosine--tRNA ligase [Alphaproteobacteria bacterium]